MCTTYVKVDITISKTHATKKPTKKLITYVHEIFCKKW